MNSRKVEDETLEEQYFQRMRSSLNDKARILDWLPEVTDTYTPHILDVGAGGGEFANVLTQLGYEVTALDANDDALNRIELLFPHIHTAHALANQVENVVDVKFDAVVCSSLLHEAFSYGDNVHRRGHISSIGRALEAFNHVLKPGGVLVIRDGVKPEDWQQTGFVKIVDTYDESVVTDYLTMCPFANGEAYGQQGTLINLTKVDDRLFAGNNQSIMEFAFTFNWDVENYPREAKEIYGVFTFDEYPEYVEQFGFTTIHKEQYVLDGYVTHLAEKVVLFDENMNKRDMFTTNALWVYRLNS